MLWKVILYLKFVGETSVWLRFLSFAMVIYGRGKLSIFRKSVNMKSLCLTFQMEASEQYCHVVIFATLYKVMKTPQWKWFSNGVG